MTSPTGREPQIALIAAPWPALNRPSIQLAALKAYIELHTECRVSAFHPYLQSAEALGPGCYATIADTSWAGEALFGALLYPERRHLAKKSFTAALGPDRHQLPPFEEVLATLESQCDAWLAAIDWSSFSLAGFSLCFNQLFSSLYLAAAIKQRAPGLPLVFGGALCGGELGHHLQRTFPQVDYVIDGEGERPLAGLCRYLTGAVTAFPERVHPIPSDLAIAPAPEIVDLNSLPLPDYEPYMQEIKRIFPDTPFIPILPVEFSRGCWWNRCTFCNLNLQWCGYRYKNSQTMATQVRALISRHRCLDFTFCDNALPPREADAFFAEMASSGHDCRFFAEIRVTGNPEQLAGYRHGGLETVQVGIESLSTSLLSRMDKGTSAIANIAMMKQALAAGIRLEGNLLLEFPGSTDKEVAETLAALEFVLPFRPLAAATFFLGHGSPVDHQRRRFGIGAVVQHRHYRRLFPGQTLRRLTLLIKEYRGDRQLQRRRWQPVRDRLASWQQFHRLRPDSSMPALAYRDGGEFIIIRQERPSAAPLRHRLQGLSREIYLYCDEIRTLAQITARFAEVKESAILAFLHQLCQKRLMFREQNQILALAVRSA